MPLLADPLGIETKSDPLGIDGIRSDPLGIEAKDTSFEDAQFIPRTEPTAIASLAPVTSKEVDQSLMAKEPIDPYKSTGLLSLDTGKIGVGFQDRLRPEFKITQEETEAANAQAKELLGKPLIELPRIPINPDDSRMVALGKQIVNVAIGVPEFFTSRFGVMAAIGGAIAPTAVAGLFTADMLHTLGQQATESGKNWDTMTPAEQGTAVGDIIGTGTFATLLGKHTVKGVRGQVAAAKERIGDEVVAQLPDVPRRFMEPGEELILRDELGQPVPFTERTAAEVSKTSSSENAQSEAVKPPTTPLGETQAATASPPKKTLAQKVAELPPEEGVPEPLTPQTYSEADLKTFQELTAKDEQLSANGEGVDTPEYKANRLALDELKQKYGGNRPIETPASVAGPVESTWRGSVKEVPKPASWGGKPGEKLYIPVDASGKDVTVQGKTVLGTTPEEAIDLATKNIISKPTVAKAETVETARARTPSQQFDDLVMEHAAERGWARNPDALYTPKLKKGEQQGTASIQGNIAHGKEMKIARRNAAIDAGITDLNILDSLDTPAGRAAALAQLKEHVEGNYGENVPKLRPGEKKTGELFQGEDQPFNLKQEQAASGERIAAEKAKKEKDAAEAKAIADREQLSIDAWTSATALDKTTQFINEGLSQQPGEIGLGSGVGSLIASPRSRAVTEDISVRPEDLASESPVVESRWQNAKLQKPSLIEKGRAALIRIKNAMTRHFPKLDPKTDGAEINILRVHEGAPLVSQYMASNALRGITADLGPNKYGVFERIVILRDLIDYGEKFLTDSKELPFGYESIEAMRSDLKRFEALSEKYPDIRNAVARRNEFMDALRDDLISRKLLHPKVKDFRSYFHHQVLEHMAMKESVAPGTGSSDVRTHTKGWQRKRVGSSKDFNTLYLESEFEVVSQSFAQMMTQDTLKRIEDVSDISKSLKAAAAQLKEEGRETDWRSLVPDDYTLWQPTRGNHFYWAQSLTEKALESFLRGEKELTKADFDEVLALGGPRKQWAIPKRLAETLDNFGPQKDHAIEKFIGAGQSQWKRWTLFNPMRNLIYEVNNLSGDLDISFAVDPKILSHTPKASKELWNFVIGKKSATPEIDYLVKQGVVDAGFSVHELPDLKGQQFFRVLSGREPGLITKYWDTVLDFNRWREGVLRYAAFDRALERLNAGENIYWASKRPEIDAMRKDPNITNREIAAKLSREAIGDYGNISHAGQWIRSKAVPFYSWMEINAPRYIRLFQNSATDGKARITGVAGKKVTITAAKASALYLLVNLWNKTMFPDEESELNQSQKQLHIILGRRDDGSIASMRFQGAFSDALGWFGGENIIKDVSEVVEGRASAGDKLTEAAKAPVNRIAGGSFPIQKTVVESVLGRQTYPDVFNPRQVRDSGRHVAQLASMGTIYDYLTSKPQRPGTWSPLSLVTYSTDPGEAAYYTARSIVSDWMNEHAKDRPETLANDKSNALYYYKQALKYKDKKLADVWKKKYLALDGTEKGLSQSIARSSPTAALSNKDKASFKSSLSPAETQIIDRADKWYQNTFK